VTPPRCKRGNTGGRERGLCKVVIESSIICEYLNDCYPEVDLAPLDPYARTQMRFWMKHVDVKLHPSCGTIQWPMVMRPALMEKSEEERNAILERVVEKPRRERQQRLVQFGLDAPDVADAVRVYRKTILDMEKALAQQDWVVGDSFSLADVCLVPYFQTLLQFNWTALYDKDCPRVADWFSRCREREAYRQGVAVDFPDQLMTDLQEKGAAVWHKIAAHLE